MKIPTEVFRKLTEIRVALVVADDNYYRAALAFLDLMEIAAADSLSFLVAYLKWIDTGEFIDLMLLSRRFGSYNTDDSLANCIIAINKAFPQ